MKKTNIAILASLLLGSTLSAMTSKAKTHDSLKGTSIGHYAKPGAPVDITYTTERVEAGDTSTVQMVLSTHVSSGTMHVTVNMGKGLSQTGNTPRNLSIPLKAGKRKYPITTKVTADEDGLYYIKLLVKIKGKGFRAFAVPVRVGNGISRITKKPTLKTGNGETITISPAQETIR